MMQMMAEMQKGQRGGRRRREAEKAEAEARVVTHKIRTFLTSAIATKPGARMPGAALGTFHRAAHTRSRSPRRISARLRLGDRMTTSPASFHVTARRSRLPGSARHAGDERSPTSAYVGNPSAAAARPALYKDWSSAPSSSPRAAARTLYSAGVVDRPAQYSDSSPSITGRRVESKSACWSRRARARSRSRRRTTCAARSPARAAARQVQRQRDGDRRLGGAAARPLGRREDVSVPISASPITTTSPRSSAPAPRSKVQLSGPDDPRAAEVLRHWAHGVAWDQPQYIVREGGAVRDGRADVGAILERQRRQYRKTFHGFAPGHALVIDSPTAFQVTPMQIDTWNRAEMNISGNRCRRRSSRRPAARARRSRRPTRSTAGCSSAR